MIAWRSFRARLLFGSALLVAGLLPIGHLLSMSLIQRKTFLLRLDHRVVVLALVLVVLGVIQLRRGLSPFDELRGRLAGVREGRYSRIEGSYPSEVQPLVDDLNSLLDHREEAVRRAVAKAGDLAHGLKTPLAVLSHEAESARTAGHAELADAMRQQVERMRRQVEYHLAHARAAASGPTLGARSSVLASVEGLSRALLRIHADRGVAIDVDVSPELSVRVQREDLDEMLGNLLDNACQWAVSRVRVASESVGAVEPGSRADRLVILVDDDGPGIPVSMRDRVLQRGVRTDEAFPGSGLGLAIVRDLAELHGGSIALEGSPAGGLRARLTLPV